MMRVYVAISFSVVLKLVRRQCDERQKDSITDFVGRRTGRSTIHHPLKKEIAKRFLGPTRTRCDKLFFEVSTLVFGWHLVHHKKLQK